MSSCKNLKENNLMKKNTKKFLFAATDSIYTREFDLKKHKVFAYTSAMLKQPKFKRSANKDTITMTTWLAIKGLNSAGEMQKKEIEWKVSSVKTAEGNKIVNSVSRVVRDIPLWRQILNSLLVTIIYFWIVIGISGGSLMHIEGKEVVLLLIFAIIMFISGIFLFGSFIISMLNAFFFLFLLASLSGYAEAKSKK